MKAGYMQVRNIFLMALLALLALENNRALRSAGIGRLQRFV